MTGEPDERLETPQQLDMEVINRVLEVGKLLMAVLSQEEILRLHQAIAEGTTFVIDKGPTKNAS